MGTIRAAMDEAATWRTHENNNNNTTMKPRPSSLQAMLVESRGAGMPAAALPQAP